MKKQLLRYSLCVLFLIGLFIISPTKAQSLADNNKLSPYLQQLLEKNIHAQSMLRRADTSKHAVCALMKLSDMDGVQQLANNYGFHAIDSIGQVYIVSVPIAVLPTLAEDHRVLRIEAHEMPRPMMFEIPQHIHADKVLAGEGLPQAFTGEGVVAGIVDDGFDFNHPMFLDNTGNQRICQFFDMNNLDTSEEKGIAYNPKQIMEMRHSPLAIQDNHGTQVASIMVGSSVNGSSVKGGKIYCGLAPGSDIVLAEVDTRGNFDDHAIVLNGPVWSRPEGTTADCILAFKQIFDYADAMGKPCVINLSMGFHMSIIDPCILEDEAIAYLTGPGHIIVAGAGNDGYHYGKDWQALYTTLRKDSYCHEVTASFYGNTDTTSTFSKAKYVDCYLLTQQKQEVCFFLGNDSIGQSITIDTDKLNNLDGDTCYYEISLAPEIGDTMHLQTVRINNPPSYILGNLYLFTASVSNSSQQTLSEWLKAHQKNETIDGHYLTTGDGLRVSVISDSPCEMYTNTILTPFIHAKSPFTKGFTECISKEHSIAWPAESPSIIAVGALNSRSILGVVLSEGENIANFSSQGPSWANLLKPEVVAPGVSIVSAQNGFGPFDNDNYYGNVSNAVDSVGEMSVCHGTSISSPMVAGAIALWLQAKPDLTPDDIREILAETCTHPNKTVTYPNNTYGYGEIDVYAGLLHILGLSGIEEVAAHQPKGIKLKLKGRQLCVLDGKTGLPYSDNVIITVYATDGRKVASTIGKSINLSTLVPGIYAVQVNTNNKEVSGSTLIRL